MSHDVFKHQLAHIEFSLHIDLEKQGGKALCNPHSMSCQKLVAHCYFVRNGVSEGEIRGMKIVLIQPCFDLSSSDEGDHWINL